VCPFSFKARRDDVAWPPPAKRSNTALDEKGRAMDTAFSNILGMVIKEQGYGRAR